jgi:flavin-dependent dehydrogenase
MSNHTNILVDVLIVGGGLAGSAAALTLARHDVSVLILEREPGPVWKIGEGLLPEARPILQSLGIWQEFQAQRHLPSFGNRSVWGGPRLSETDSIFNPFGHGWYVDRVQFQRLLHEHVASVGAEIKYGVRVASSDTCKTGMVVRAKSNEQPLNISCRKVLDCSGRSAAVALSNGGRRYRVDYLTCVYTKVADISASGMNVSNFTLVESAPDGWWYTVRLPQGKRLIAYLSDGDLINESGMTSLAKFKAGLMDTSALRELCAGYENDSFEPLKTVPAFSSKLEPVFGKHWIAAGDTAFSADPLSSQGLLWALRGGKRSAELVLSERSGNGGALSSYSLDLERQFNDYIKQRFKIYSAERRWSDRAFWKRRHQASTTNEK